MRGTRRLALIIALLLAAGAAHAESSVQELIKKGDEHYRKRNHEQDAWEAVGLYKEALKAAPGSYEVLWRLARSLVDIGEQSKNKAKQRELGQEALDLAQQATQVKPNGVEGWFYSAAGIGVRALGSGVVTAVREGVATKFRRYVDRAIALDPGYDHAGPLMSLGRFHYELPWPMRDLKKSIALLEDAHRRAPTKLRTRLYLAESLAADGRKPEALAHARACVEMDPAKEDPIDARRVQPLCRALVAKLEK